jgi:hypothetical protein
VALLGSACHRYYLVRGDVVINPGVVMSSRMPALLCTGRGGSPDVSAMSAQPLTDERGGVALVLCHAPDRAVRLPFTERLYYGSLPRQMHIYAFTEPAPDAQPMCDSQPDNAVVQISTAEWGGYRRCFDRQWPSNGMAFTVTFDDSKAKTWTEEDGTWTEKRDIALR